MSAWNRFDLSMPIYFGRLPKITWGTCFAGFPTNLKSLTTSAPLTNKSCMNMDLLNRKVEIGSTWIAPAWQRTSVNTEAKYLMLRHAFENWKCLRLELKTDAMNQRSRQAILRLGAKEEGVLRKHMLCWDGRQRDSVYFSILDTEWPEVKARLEQKLAQKY